HRLAGNLLQSDRPSLVEPPPGGKEPGVPPPQPPEMSRVGLPASRAGIEPASLSRVFGFTRGRKDASWSRPKATDRGLAPRRLSPRVRFPDACERRSRPS